MNIKKRFLSIPVRAPGHEIWNCDPHTNYEKRKQVKWAGRVHLLFFFFLIVKGTTRCSNTRLRHQNLRDEGLLNLHR
jgi:hypothetical protein